MRVLIKGAGDIASGVALRLFHCGFSVLMTDLVHPTAIRRSVAFCNAALPDANGIMTVEDVTAQVAHTPAEGESILAAGRIPLFLSEAGSTPEIPRDILVDGILAKRNTGTAITDAAIVIALGPGFTAGVDCHAVIETLRGHTLGRVILNGSTLPNTGVPGEIGGETARRVLRAPADGVFYGVRHIGEQVNAADVIGTVGSVPMRTVLTGVLRGILPDGTPVLQGMKSGDVDPRCTVEHCYTVSDKALSVAGGVLEAILRLSRR